MRSVSISRIGAAFWLLALAAPVGAAPAPFASHVGPVADKMTQFLQDEKQEAVTLGAFTAPKDSTAQAGPGIAHALADALRQRKIKIEAKARCRAQGSYALVTDAGKLLGVRIKVEIIEQPSKVLGTFDSEVLFLDTTAADGDGAKALAPLLGLTVVLPPDENLKARQQRFQEHSTKPSTHLDSSRVFAAEASPYAVEIVVNNKASTPRLENGLAYVDLKRGDRYAVRLINQTDAPVAVTLSIDGLSIFSFSQKQDYTYVVIPPKQSGLIEGWHRTNEESDAFEVTDYSKSAAAQLLPQAPQRGCITATFALCWPKNARTPEDERTARLMASRGEKLATGRGPVIKASFEETEMHIGAVRAAVSVRYTRPE
ncbi:MAG: hypothetical protein K2R98_15585 [Gemmataceae bacterium]|nr:hypothetical protein [Gemmataceae bacterium]